jgi:hypothetical protein
MGSLDVLLSTLLTVTFTLTSPEGNVPVSLTLCTTIPANPFAARAVTGV